MWGRDSYYRVVGTWEVMSFHAALNKLWYNVPLMKDHESLCQLTHLCTVTAKDLHSQNDLLTI